jgi:hypothetical protein
VAARRDHDWGFFYFAAVGFLIAFGFISGFSIGIPILLAGLVLLVLPPFKRFGWPDDLGLLAGVGVVCLVIASLQVLGDPRLWALIGAALIGAGSFAFWWLRCK